MSARDRIAHGKQKATRADYIRIARLSHVTKHIFIIPGIVIAWLFRPVTPAEVLPHFVVGFLAFVAVASANYVINEWLDRETDAYHPEKSMRAAVQRELSAAIVIAQYALILALGLILASLVSQSFFVVVVLFAVSGIIYNVRPLRTKDIFIGDVLTESVNNPIRLTGGWLMVDSSTIPPGSLLLAFWFGGAFLMNSKRLAEYRDIVSSRGKDTLVLYRKSFKHYSENNLSVANLVYALLCSFFIAIFLIKYRIEYVLLFPSVVWLFGTYYALALQRESVARKPELLLKSPRLIVASIVFIVLFILTSKFDMPFLNDLTEQKFISLPNG